MDLAVRGVQKELLRGKGGKRKQDYSDRWVEGGRSGRAATLTAIPF